MTLKELRDDIEHAAGDPDIIFYDLAMQWVDAIDAMIEAHHKLMAAAHQPISEFGDTPAGRLLLETAKFVDEKEAEK